ncbi:type IX secretion system protein PorG [Parabacteroides chinchillae]
MTSTFFQRVLIIILLAGSFPVLYAQEYKYEIGGMAGGACYMGDANKNAFFKGLNPALGAVFRYNANFRWAVKADLLWGRISGSTAGLDNVFPDNAQVSFNRNLIELGGQMEFNFFPYSDKFAYANAKRFSPYVLLGLGMTVAPGNGSTMASVNVPLGVGVKYKLKNRINLGCEFSFRKLFGDNLEGNAVLDNPYGIKSSFLKNKDWYSLLLLSVTWDFGPRNRPCNNKNSISGY